MAQSLVSGQQLQSIAQAAGIEYRQTLTGFKWIGRILGLVYGYEEALGYCVDPQTVRDKDGISAALLVIELASHLKAQGRTLQDALDDLAREHGVYATDQVSTRVSHLGAIPRIMSALRQAPPRVIGGITVTQFTDLELGSADLPPTDGLLFSLDGGARVIVRPSGTEPKVKCYLQAVEKVEGTDLVGARQRAQAVLSALAADVRGWLQ
jgi:phosphomannomutase